MSALVVVTGGIVLTPSGPRADGRVVIEDGRIVAVEPATTTSVPGAVVVDAGGGWIAPGFIDLQVNGGAGIDLTTGPERLSALAADLVRQGVTAFLPTVITAPADRRDAALRAWAAHSSASAWAGAAPLGVHFEGPMISPARLGAHPAEHVRPPSPKLIEGWARETGVALVTLAPELPGAVDVVRDLVGRDVVVALGHTDAALDDVDRAVQAGASYVTHLYNAMRPFGHRDPGPIGRVLGGDQLVAGLIVDRIHVDPLAVRMAWRALGPERVNLVTDAVASRGGGPGTGVLGDRAVRSEASGAVRTASGALAGSLLTLDTAVRNLVEITACSVADAVRTVTAVPASLLGLPDRGALTVGARGDVVVLSPALEVETVLIGGAAAWSAAAVRRELGEAASWKS